MNQPKILLPAIIMFVMCVAADIGFTQGTAFMYSGRLVDAGQAANGAYDLQYTVFDSLNGSANIVGGPVTNLATTVTGGLFEVMLDFGGGVFTGPPRWLEIAARTNSGASFTILRPRQPVLPVPYAIYSTGAANSSGNLTGTFVGDASGLTNLVSSSFSSTNPIASQGVTNYSVNFSGAIYSYITVSPGDICFNQFTRGPGAVSYFILGQATPVNILWPTNALTLVTNGLRLQGTNWLFSLSAGTRGFVWSAAAITNLSSNGDLTNVFVTWAAAP